MIQISLLPANRNYYCYGFPHAHTRTRTNESFSLQSVVPSMSLWNTIIFQSWRIHLRIYHIVHTSTKCIYMYIRHICCITVYIIPWFNEMSDGRIAKRIILMHASYGKGSANANGCVRTNARFRVGQIDTRHIHMHTHSYSYTYFSFVRIISKLRQLCKISCILYFILHTKRFSSLESLNRRIVKKVKE